MRIAAVVPMKLNNRRLPQKNIMPFTNGKPLCTYILNTLCTVSEIDDIYVYCSDDAINDFIPKGAKFLRRPQFLDQDDVKMNEVLLHFAEDVCADVYILAHATAPFLKRESILKGINAVTGQGFDSAFSVRRMQDFLWKDGKPLNYELDDIPRTQDLQPYYVETSGFYIYKAEVISKLHRRIGIKPFMVEVGGMEGIDIDEKEDFVIADAVYNHIYQRCREI